MNLQSLYANRLNLTFKLRLPMHDTDPFEYAQSQDRVLRLFLKKQAYITFIEWNDELTPPDPRYGQPADRLPVLHQAFPNMNIYDEQIFNFLLLTINMTPSIAPITSYNAMNIRMKQYAFFQLARLFAISQFSPEQKADLRDFFFWFYLYAHPVNGETLEAFAFTSSTHPQLIHTATGIAVRDYIQTYHAHYANPLSSYEDQLKLSSQEIDTCLNLTLQLLDAVEGNLTSHTPTLPTLPEAPEWDAIIQWLNRPQDLLAAYQKDRTALFNALRHMMNTTPDSGKRNLPHAAYRDHLASMLLDSYVCYILYLEFNELLDLITYFENEPMLLKQIVSRLFTDTLFLQKILHTRGIDLVGQYPQVTAYFDQTARSMWGISE